MKKLGFLFLFILGIWALSAMSLISFFGLPESLSEAGEMFGAVSSLFSGIALIGIAYTAWIQNEQVRLNRESIKETAQSNKDSLEIMALSALINESDAALSRYERWEKSSKDSDYQKAKATVRDKLKKYRAELEQKANTDIYW